LRSCCVHCDPADGGALAIRTGESGEGDDAYKFLFPLPFLHDHDLAHRITTINSSNNNSMRLRAASTPPSSPPEAPARSATAPPAASSPTPTASRHQAADEEILAARERLFEAQRHFPHDAGVFVGNLSTRLTDVQLLNEVKRAFSRYGRCEVMLSRTTVVNGQGKPWAIVQYQVRHFTHSSAHSRP
jgi:hypothetical protein